MATLFIAEPEEAREVQPANGKTFKLEELQGFVMGYIEIVIPQNRRHRGKILIINEEGKLKGLPYNRLATEAYNMPFDAVVGDALLCKDGEVD